MSVTVRRSELREFEFQVLVQLFNEPSFWQRKPSLLFSENVDHTAIAEFAKEWRLR
jgi:hypothetical protein